MTVYGEEQPLSFEAMVFGLAEKRGLPGFGPDGLEEGRPLSRPEDFYLPMAANVAAGDKEDPVEAAPDEEITYRRNTTICRQFNAPQQNSNLRPAD